MIFSSILFLIFFLPIVLSICLLLPKKKSSILAISSLTFYAVGALEFVPILIFIIVISFIGGLWIKRLTEYRNLKLASIILFLLLPLILYKYVAFFLSNLNGVFYYLGMESIEVPEYILPIGISFFTFQAISYVIDVYRSPELLQSNPIKLSVYIMFFPQLIAGPIVRYKEFRPYLDSIQMNFAQIGSGSRRFIIGLGKKVILADGLKAFCDPIFGNIYDGISPSIAWLALLAYALQIYFDFSGYSDMAIGMGRMFGIRIPENFNYPYISKSVREFWSRWHITLSTWFRDYVYYPLGGSHLGRNRKIINIMVLFLLIGFWHGASWNWIVWGGFYGLMLVIESTILKSFLSKSSNLIQHLYALPIIILPFVWTKYTTIHQAVYFYASLLGLRPYDERATEFLWNLYTPEIGLLLLIGILISVPWPNTFYRISEILAFRKNYLTRIRSTSIAIFQFGILILCILYLLGGSYNAFFYFQF